MAIKDDCYCNMQRLLDVNLPLYSIVNITVYWVLITPGRVPRYSFVFCSNGELQFVFKYFKELLSLVILLAIFLLRKSNSEYRFIIFVYYFGSNWPTKNGSFYSIIFRKGTLATEWLDFCDTLCDIIRFMWL